MLFLPTIQQIDLGFVTIQWWGLWAALGFLAGIALAMLEAKRKKFNKDQAFNIYVLSAIAAVLGAKISSAILMHYGEGMSWREIWSRPGEGFMLFGGLVLGVAVMWLLAKAYKKRFWLTGDLLAPAVAANLAFVRVGCMLIHDHPGKLGSFLGLIGYKPTNFSAVRHEPALYHFVLNLLIFVAIWALRKRIKREGNLLLLLAFLYGIGRFIADFARVDPKIWLLTPMQWISLVLVVGSAGWYLKTMNGKETK